MSSEDAAPAPAEAWLAEAPSDAILPEVAPAEEPAPAAEKPFAAVEAEGENFKSIIAPQRSGQVAGRNDKCACWRHSLLPSGLKIP